MLCLPSSFYNPTISAFLSGIFTMFMFYLSSYSIMLPIGFVISLMVSYIVYYLMGGQMTCGTRPLNVNNNVSYQIQ
jgi:hypothetical protein